MDPINERIDKKISESGEYYDEDMPDSVYEGLPKIVKVLYLEDDEDLGAMTFVFEDGTKVFGSEKMAMQVTPDGQESVIAYKSLAKGPYGIAVNRYEVGHGQDTIPEVPMTDADFQEWSEKFTG